MATILLYELLYELSHYSELYEKCRTAYWEWSSN